jgi:L-lactate dehydrogenase complex protein LldF
MFGNVTLYKLATKSAYYLQKPLARNGFIKSGPPPLSGWTQSRFMPMLPKQSFRDKWAALQAELAAKPRVGAPAGGSAAKAKGGGGHDAN